MKREILQSWYFIDMIILIIIILCIKLTFWYYSAHIQNCRVKFLVSISRLFSFRLLWISSVCIPHNGDLHRRYWNMHGFVFCVVKENNGTIKQKSLNCQTAKQRNIWTYSAVYFYNPWLVVYNNQRIIHDVWVNRWFNKSRPVSIYTRIWALL